MNLLQLLRLVVQHKKQICKLHMNNFELLLKNLMMLQGIFTKGQELHLQEMRNHIHMLLLKVIVVLLEELVYMLVVIQLILKHNKELTLKNEIALQIDLDIKEDKSIGANNIYFRKEKRV